MSYIEASDTSLRKTGQIKLHGPSGFAGMRKAGALVAKCLDELTDIVKPGVPTSRIDDFVRDFAFAHDAYPATLMYRGYRYSTCTSINHVVCHGMPGDRVLKEGDRQHRRHLHRRGLVWRFQPDVRGRPDRPQGRTADRGDL
jgi:methionyl aminopeptidase